MNPLAFCKEFTPRLGPEEHQSYNMWTCNTNRISVGPYYHTWVQGRTLWNYFCSLYLFSSPLFHLQLHPLSVYASFCPLNYTLTFPKLVRMPCFLLHWLRVTCTVQCWMMLLLNFLQQWLFASVASHIFQYVLSAPGKRGRHKSTILLPLPITLEVWVRCAGESVQN